MTNGAQASRRLPALVPVFLAVGVAALLVLGLAPRAEAVLVYQRAGTREIVAARDDGSGAHMIARGIDPLVSPNGRWVIFATPRRANADLKLVRIEGGRVHFLMHNFPACTCGPLIPGLGPVWSPDSRYVLAVDASDGITQLIDLARHTKRDLECSGSFSPDVTRIAVGCEDLTPYSDSRTILIYGLRARRYKRIGWGYAPLWGPVGLAFVRDAGLVLERRIGGRARVVYPCHGCVLRPVDWSRRGRTLLAAYGLGEFEWKALLVHPNAGPTITLAPTFSEIDSLSRHGKWVLGVTGGNVVAMAANSATRLLARHALSASWTK